jgi:hypothetical protein
VVRARREQARDECVEDFCAPFDVDALRNIP